MACDVSGRCLFSHRALRPRVSWFPSKRVERDECEETPLPYREDDIILSGRRAAGRVSAPEADSRLCLSANLTIFLSDLVVHGSSEANGH